MMVGFWSFIVQMDPSNNPSDRKGLGWPDGAKDGRGHPRDLDGMEPKTPTIKTNVIIIINNKNKK
jgi:hypothetical protein